MSNSVLPLSPCGRGWRVARLRAASRVRGHRRQVRKNPSPALASLGHPLPQGERGNASDVVLAAHHLHPSFAHHQATKNSSNRFPQQKGKRSAERRIVLPMSAPQTSLRSLRKPSVRGVRAVLVARPPFGAHAGGTRHRLLPRWLSSRTGFPAASANGCFARFAQQKEQNAAVKHAPCGPVFVPVDRGPKAARERKGRASARRHRISLSPIRRHRLFFWGRRSILTAYFKQWLMRTIKLPSIGRENHFTRAMASTM
jgi:hypothetical protein